MEQLLEDISHFHFLNQFWLTLFFIIPILLVSRAVVAGTRYSPILIIVIFGLCLGYVLSLTGLTGPGLPDYPMLAFLSRTTVIALAFTFFVGGQELRKTFSGQMTPPDDFVVYAKEEVTLGTGRTQFILIIRTFFLLLGMEGLIRLINGVNPGDSLSRYYPVIAYFGIVVSTIFIDSKAQLKNKQQYLRKGVLEIVVVLGVLAVTFQLSVAIRSLIALPQIFFVMVATAALGAICHRWVHGPTIRCMLFAGIPIILAANFLIGGSLIGEAFTMEGVGSLLTYGFFGQIFWMFGGIALLMLLGRTASVRNLAPGMAGALSHAGLTGACTAGDFGEEAARRAPIMINIPFATHIFVFSVLAFSMESGKLLLIPSIILAVLGAGSAILGFWILRQARGREKNEVEGLMFFCLGWQIVALFAGFLALAFSGISLPFSAMATSSALSHFGLFAAVQGGMFGIEAVGMISFIFAMPFLVHPFVFFLFGRAMEKGGEMPAWPVFMLATVGITGMVYGLLFIG
jgi:hypothetical protein